MVSVGYVPWGTQDLRELGSTEYSRVTRISSMLSILRCLGYRHPIPYPYPTLYNRGYVPCGALHFEGILDLCVLRDINCRNHSVFRITRKFPTLYPSLPYHRGRIGRLSTGQGSAYPIFRMTNIRRVLGGTGIDSPRVVPRKERGRQCHRDNWP